MTFYQKLAQSFKVVTDKQTFIWYDLVRNFFLTYCSSTHCKGLLGNIRIFIVEYCTIKELTGVKFGISVPNVLQVVCCNVVGYVPAV